MKITKRHSVDSIPLDQGGGTYLYTSFTHILEMIYRQGTPLLNQGEIITEIVIENRGISLKIMK